MDSGRRDARRVDTISCWRSLAPAAVCVPHARPAIWPKRRRIWSTMCFPKCRCTNGYWHCPSACGISCTATPSSQDACSACSCAHSSKGGARVVRAHRRRHASARSRLSSASPHRSIQTCTTTAPSSTVFSASATVRCAFTQRVCSVKWTLPRWSAWWQRACCACSSAAVCDVHGRTNAASAGKDCSYNPFAFPPSMAVRCTRAASWLATTISAAGDN